MSLWTPERVEVLKTMWTDGASFSEIAKELNCGLSRNACIGKASRIGLGARQQCPPKTTHRNRLCIKTTPRERANYGLAADRIKRASRKRKVSAPVIELQRPYHFIGISFLDIGRNQCRFPQGEGVGLLFCGNPTDEGASWCEHCRGVVFSKQRMKWTEERREQGRLIRARQRAARRKAEQAVMAA